MQWIFSLSVVHKCLKEKHTHLSHHLDMFFNYKESRAEDMWTLVAVFPFKAFGNVLEEWSCAKNKPQVSVQYFFITWQHDSRRVLLFFFFFSLSTCLLLAQECFFQTCQSQLEFALKFIGLKCWGTPQGLSHCHCIQGLREESEKIIKKRFLRKSSSGW